jgi:simple sugar transport system permease protein
MFLLSMVIGAAAAGLAGAMEVSGVQHRLIEGIHSNFATLGLIIGLISRGKNQAVPFVAFFIAVLEVGASAMQRTMMIPSQVVLIVEALIVIFILLSDLIKRRQK